MAFNTLPGTFLLRLCRQYKLVRLSIVVIIPIMVETHATRKYTALTGFNITPEARLYNPVLIQSYSIQIVVVIV